MTPMKTTNARRDDCTPAMQLPVPPSAEPPSAEPPAPSLGAALEASFELVGNLLGNAEHLVRSVQKDAAQITQDSQELYRLATSRAESMRDAAKAAPRMVRIVREGIAIVARYRVHHSRAQHLDPERRQETLEALHRDCAKRLYTMCIELRGGVLKLGQFLSARMDLLPPAYVEELAKLQDRVPAVQFDEIASVIEAELGRPISEIFREIDPKPIAAASLAQVQRATLLDGRQVAVKVQVPGVDELVQADIAAMRIVAGVAGDLVRHTDLETILGTLGRAIRRELDFRNEAVELHKFAQNFSANDKIVVPQVIETHSTRRLLTMELVQGRRLVEYLDGADPADRDTLLGNLIGSFCEQVLKHGRFQADPHPGNFLVLEGPRLCLLDFGCVGTLTPDQRVAYQQIAFAILARDASRVATLLAQAGFVTRNGDAGTLLELAELMLQEFREGATDWTQIDPQEQLQRVMEITRSNPVVQLPREFVLLGRVFGTLGGLVLHYQPRIELFSLIAPYLIAPEQP